MSFGHTVAILMLSRNINPKVVKYYWAIPIFASHSTYSHVLPSVHKETAQQYGNMLFGTQQESKEREASVVVPPSSLFNSGSDSSTTIQ
jgi:hypothetical protein